RLEIGPACDAHPPGAAFPAGRTDHPACPCCRALAGSACAIKKSGGTRPGTESARSRRCCMSDAISPGDKAKTFPAAPGVYLMKDEQGRVIYVGKAKNLRNRASHYFTQAAAQDRRTCDLVKLIADIDFIEAESEVDALLLEAR